MHEPSSGYLTICQDNGLDDYVRMAYALALSLRGQSDKNRLSIVVDAQTKVEDRYRAAFDEVVVLDYDRASLAEWKIHNKPQLVHISPYHRTVLLDADMIFTADVGAWWEYMTAFKFLACTSVLTYRGEVATSDYYRKTFTANDLPNVYTAFMYFEKSDEAREIFRLADEIIVNWDAYVERYLWNHPPSIVSGDVAFALALKLSGVPYAPTTTWPTFVHMKSKMQGWPVDTTEAWTRHVAYEVHDDGTLRVGGYRQIAPFHYHRKEFLTEDVLRALEAAYAR